MKKVVKISSDNRIGQVCDSQTVEGEFHFVMHCKLYDEHRQTLFNEISEILDIAKYTLETLFKIFMGATDYDIAKSVITFVSRAYDIRNVIVI